MDYGYFPRAKTWQPLRDEDGCFESHADGPLSKRGIADLLRAAAAGYAVDGDTERAATLRKQARGLEGRDGPGEPYRRHKPRGST